MTKGRLEAFSDGVIAIIITITVLLIDAPDGKDFSALLQILPLAVVYAVSFIVIGTHWANHHHLLQVAKHVNGKILWANLFYLFTLSFYPVATGWVGKSNFSPAPITVYALINLVEAIAYIILQKAILSSHDCVVLKNVINESQKEFFTILLDVTAVICSLIPKIRFMTFVLLLGMTALWIVPDLRLKKAYMMSNSGEKKHKQ